MPRGTTAVRDYFSSATVATKQTSPKKALRPTKKIAGVELAAAFRRVLDAVESAYNTHAEPLKEAGFEEFLEEGLKTGAKPLSFNAEEGRGEVNVQFKKNTTLKALTDIERAVLDANDIPTEHIVKVPETYIINPEYLTPEIMEKISRALSKENLPIDLFQKQEGVSHYAASEAGITASFAKGKRVAREVLGIQTNVALRPSWNGTTQEAFEKVLPLLAENLQVN